MRAMSDALGLILISWCAALAAWVWTWVYCLWRNTDTIPRMARFAYRYSMLATLFSYGVIVLYGVVLRPR